MRPIPRRTILEGGALGAAALALGGVPARAEVGRRVYRRPDRRGGMGGNHLRLLAARQRRRGRLRLRRRSRPPGRGGVGRREGLGQGPEGGEGPPPGPRRPRASTPSGSRPPTTGTRPAAILALRRGQARLRREAVLPQHPRGAADGRGGGPLGQAPPGRHPEPQHRRRPGRHRPRPRRGDRRGAGGQGLEQPAAAVDRQDEAVAARRRSSTSTSGSAPRRWSPTGRTCSPASGAGGTTSAAATSATTASTTSTSPAGAWASTPIPSRVACLGGKSFFDDDQQFPDTQYAVFEYPDAAGPGRAKQLIFEQRIWSPYVQEGYENGAAFYGTEGMLVIGHSVGWTLYGPRNKKIAERTGPADLAAHHQNFLDCVRGDVEGAQRRRRRPGTAPPPWSTWPTSGPGSAGSSTSTRRPRRSSATTRPRRWSPAATARGTGRCPKD